MKTKICLILIIILAATLRLWNISSNPPGLTWDEAALGYNAYSLLQTGKDEYGDFLPLNLKSFGDYKPAFYSYLVVPFVAVLGLNEFAVRLPSALSGILIVWGVFLLTKEIFKNNTLSLLSSFFMAVSPLGIQFSRVAFEANVALALILFGSYLFVKGQKYRLVAILLFGLSLFTYQSARIFAPLLSAGLFFLFKEKGGLLYNLKKQIIPLSLFITIIVILFITTFLSGQTSRLSTLNFFAYTRSTDDINLIAAEDGLQKNDLVFQIMHGEWWAYVRGLVERYTVYFSPKFLIIDGDYDKRHRVPDLGVMYYFSTVLLPLGFWYLLKFKMQGKLLFLWLLLAPIPAVLSRDLINMIRAFNVVPVLEIIQGMGFYYLLIILKEKTYSVKILSIMFITLIFLTNFSIYLDRYFIHAPKQYSQDWLYGYKETVDFLMQNPTDKRIVFTDYYHQPYIYYLFYTKYPPEKYQKQAKLEQLSTDVGTVRKIDNIEFREIYWPGDRGLKDTLFIGTKQQLPDQDTFPFPEYEVKKDVKFLDGTVAFRILQSK